MTLPVDTTTADSSDHDIAFGISDGVSFVGFQAHDKDNVLPCFKFEGKVVSTKLHNGQEGTGPMVASQKYSSEMKIQIKPTEK